MIEQRHFEGSGKLTSNAMTLSRLTEHMGNMGEKRSSDQGEDLSSLPSCTSSSMTEFAAVCNALDPDLQVLNCTVAFACLGNTYLQASPPLHFAQMIRNLEDFRDYPAP